MRKTPADREQGLIGGMSGDQVIGLPSSTLQCGESLEEGFRLLEEYRGEQETLQRSLMNLSQGFEHLLNIFVAVGGIFVKTAVDDLRERAVDAIRPVMGYGRGRLLDQLSVSLDTLASRAARSELVSCLLGCIGR